MIKITKPDDVSKIKDVSVIPYINNLVSSIIKTTAIFSKNHKERYLLKLEWDKCKKSLAIIMIFPSSADELIFDQTTMLVRNEAVKNAFGSVSIINLFSTVNNESPKKLIKQTLLS